MTRPISVLAYDTWTSERNNSSRASRRETDPESGDVMFTVAPAKDLFIRDASSSLPLAVSTLGTTENAVVEHHVELQVDGEGVVTENP